MKKRLVVLAVCMAAAVLSGCGGVKPPQAAAGGDSVTDAPTGTPAVPSRAIAPGEPNGASGPGGDQATSGIELSAGLKFEVLKGASMLPDDLKFWTENSTPPKKAYARIGDSVYVLVDGGQQPSGGYAVAVDRVEISEGPTPMLRVLAKVLAPAPGSIVTEAITYPRAYIRINWTGKDEPQVMVAIEKVQAAAKPGGEPVQKPGTGADMPGDSGGSTGGGSSGSPGTGVTNPSTPVASGPAGPAALKYEAVSSAALPVQLASWRNAAGRGPGAAAAYAGDALYVMVSAGEKPTGGYRVEIRSVQILGGRVVVKATLIQPKPGSMVTQALTYPTAYVRVAARGSGELPAEVQWQ